MLGALVEEFEDMEEMEEEMLDEEEGDDSQFKVHFILQSVLLSLCIYAPHLIFTQLNSKQQNPIHQFTFKCFLH